MKKIGLKHAFLGAFLALGVVTQAQQTNVFLERDFWATNPTIETIDLKIKEGNDPAKLNERSFDAVATAILGDAPITTIKYLLSKEGNDVNKLTHDGRTYIFWAANKGNVELMEYLLKQGARTDISDDHGYNLLNFAATGGQKNTKVYDLCLANGLKLTDVNHDGANALLLVSQRATDFSTINYFTAKGLDLNSKDAHGNGIFNYVAKSGNTDMLDQLIAKGVDYKNLNNDGGNAMIFASAGGRGPANSLDVFKYLESKGIQANVTTKTGVTPLHGLAGKSKDQEVITYFLAKGVDVNQSDQNGDTPFLKAAAANDVAIIKLLQPKLKDINAANKKGATALALAVQNNNTEMVSYLLNQGANINMVDANGNNLTAYLFESFSPRNKDDFKPKLELLTSKGLDITKPQANGDTLYHLALNHNGLGLLKLAAKHNVDINAKNSEGITPLLKAAMSAKNDKVLKYLLENGADKMVTTEFEETAFDLASENELLKANNININFLK
ncbi:ankyrin repeat domain-containing protein [Formosa sediminum]|uniref:Ankyrin repeat domain-containing protein n=1 Tax=Formosa sediminum TaxID=2594004 RepID=A0A516GNG2_9FLAO|nr:ankyrin repeat domain-containing protein [Formosa sediminum]QDO93035.1 ankyrin repeat domain-containing protein [Formosa sediminum]